MTINESIFKKYDIRGIYPSEVSEDSFYKIGKAFVSFLGRENPVIVLGRDGRKSSPSLFASFKRGVLEAGGNVLNTGISNTPLLYFAVARFGYDGGAMITASHNPGEFNGVKLVKEKSLQVHSEEIQRIKEIIKRGDFQKGSGKEEERSFLDDYLDYMTSFADNLRDLKVVINCANGVGAVTAKPLFSKLKVESFFLNEEIDGSFPNHLPDPGDSKALAMVQEEVFKKKADLGAIFDGDADRCILVDEKGEIIPTDILVALLAKEELKNNPGEEVYHDLRFSMAVSEEIKKEGGKPIIMKVGNPFYKEKIIKEGCLLGAELSGHVMFRENFGIDDGLFVLLKTMHVLQREKKSISSLLFPFRRYFQTKEINLKVKDKEKALQRTREFFSDGEEINLDGVYIKYKDWWFNLRKSNTEDLVRLRIEAKTKECLEEKKGKLEKIIKEN